MSGLFLFRFDDESNHRKESLVVFVANSLSSAKIDAAIKRDVSENLTPSKVYIISLFTQREELGVIASDTSRVKKLSALISNDESECIEFIEVCHEGNFLYIKNNEKLANDLQEKILEAGGVEIFRKRKGLLTSSPHYHFVKPSGDHCDKFIRVSNLLTSGNEVAFMALGILPFIASDIKHIYVDTSSISFLVMTALQLSGKYTVTLPAIESFESYSGINTKYDFVESAASMVFISATTSGGLNLKLEKNTRLHKDNIVTLFFSNLKENQKGIFDISSAMTSQIVSTPADECSFCQDNSKLINIVSEQFIPENPRHESFLIRKPHFTEDRAKFFKEFALNNLLQWNKSETTNLHEHFYIDIAKYLEIDSLSSKFILKLHEALNKSFSIDIKTIVTLDDLGSDALTEKVKDHIGAVGEKLKWMSLKELENDETIELNSVMVIAGSITSGRKLLEASRKLRKLNDNASIKYLVGISKLPTKDVESQLRKDVAQGGHELIILKDCPLPRIKDHVITSWDLEKRLFQQYDDPLGDKTEVLPADLLVRKAELDNNDSQNSLFLSTTNNEMLVLRSTFAFWSDLEMACNKASQADVYWTIQAIMHDLRLKNTDTGLESTYHSTVLSPICFDRYNDGIIQACLLRSATPAELNYTIDEYFSRQMTDILVSIIESWKIAQGEGCLEFLMALATKRMKILPLDLLRVLKLFHLPDMNETVKFLLRHTADEYSIKIDELIN